MSGRFESLIALQLDGEWVAVEDAEHALRILENDWPGIPGPSYDRAVQGCRACNADNGPAVGAMATFAVAAMEAGIQFERHDDYLAFTGARVASVVELNIREARAEVSRG